LLTGNLVIGAETTAKLTLVPGTDLRALSGVEIRIGLEGKPGALIAEGTSENPIRFLPDYYTTTTSGLWRGLHFWQADGSKLDRVEVHSAGATGSIGKGNVSVYREIGPFITNSYLSNSSGCGLVLSSGNEPGSTRVTTDFTHSAYNNRFNQTTAGNQCYLP
jgi:hypothetical protein